MGVIPSSAAKFRKGNAESCLKVKVIDYSYIFSGPEEKKIDRQWRLCGFDFLLQSLNDAAMN